MIFIFRRDLRLVDNVGLNLAVQHARDADAVVLPVFIFTPEQISKANAYRSANAINFMFESLRELDELLRKSHGSQLHMFYGKNEVVMRKIIRAVHVVTVVYNRDYTPYAVARDAQIRAVCESAGVACMEAEDYLLAPMGTYTKTGDTPYVVFTPFRNNAVRTGAPPKPDGTTVTGAVGWHTGLANVKGSVGFEINPVAPNRMLVRGGRAAGLRQLARAAKTQKSYNRIRDALACHTTELSAYIKFGCVSIREVYWRMRNAYGMRNELISQLYWREFYYYISYYFPEVLRGSVTKTRKNANYADFGDRLRWNTSVADYRAWCEGRTGYPVVDAGMRQLNATGYMHNRARLITANFLNRMLNIDWRMGEKYYATRLTDYDPAVNNGNWQWIASTGVDPKPYNQRLFNPWIQSKKFDPDGTYIRTWVPSLAGVPAAHLHAWDAHRGEYDLAELEYVAPIVDYTTARVRSLANYKHAKKN
jgi:deoxyribodipyrimidine photo-lyase